jgi:hypothetical protein
LGIIALGGFLQMLLHSKYMMSDDWRKYENNNPQFQFQFMFLYDQEYKGRGTNSNATRSKAVLHKKYQDEAKEQGSTSTSTGTENSYTKETSDEAALKHHKTNKTASFSEEISSPLLLEVIEVQKKNTNFSSSVLVTTEKAEEETTQEENSNTTTAPPKVFGACLKISDDNMILPEWLAYHYTMLPLRFLVVANDDSRSQVSPLTILQQWTNHTDLRYWLWTDDDFLTQPKLLQKLK